MKALALALLLSPAAAPAAPGPLAAISAVGDLVPDFGAAQEVQDQVRFRDGYEAALDYPFAKVRGQLRGLVFGNLETPVTRRGIVRFADKDEIFYFRSPTRTALSLARAGFDVLSLANNHIKDAGVAGMLDSRDLLRAQGLQAVGVGMDLDEARQPVLLREGQATLAVLAYVLVPPRSVWATSATAGAATGDLVSISADVRRARTRADAVIVSLHWGHELAYDVPATPPTAAQRRLARGLIEAGASLVLGHHSHSASLVEEHKHGLIAYSLGNFVFAGTTKSGHKHSYILRAVLAGEQVLQYSLLPVLIDPRQVRYQPRPVWGPEGRALLDRWLPPEAAKHRLLPGL